jgi:hypothetical protein
MESLSVDMRLLFAEPPPRQPPQWRRFPNLPAIESSRDYVSDPGDHDPDLGDHPGDHDGPIRAITMR